MDSGKELDWQPNMLTLEQVQAVLTHHREINIDFVISVFALCLAKKKRKKKPPSLEALRQNRHKLGGLPSGF
jgi:hypothetical protein